MTQRQPPTDHPPSAEAAIVFLDPAPGDLESQRHRLAAWAERQARRLATRPGHDVQSAPRAHTGRRAAAKGDGR